MAEAKKPNILVIWGDDIGTANLSIYTRGLMGYRTPNIDRVANEGMLFTDSYAEQSCTAGRSAFITGNRPATSNKTTCLISSALTNSKSLGRTSWIPCRPIAGNATSALPAMGSVPRIDLLQRRMGSRD